jgi:hypothetical protein
LPRPHRLARVPAAVAFIATVLVSGCGAPVLTDSAPDLTPVPGAVGVSIPRSFPPATTQVIQDAIDRLDTLGSWRFMIAEEGQDGAEGASRGVVVNTSPHRTRTDELAGGAVTVSTIEIGSRSWMSADGTTWQADPFGDPGGEPADGGGLPLDPGVAPGSGGTDEDWSNPLDGTLWVVTDSPGAVVADLGVEQHSGVVARHLHVTVAEHGSGVSDSTGMGFTGSVDVWIAADRGYLVGARARGTTSTEGFDDNGNPTGSPEVAPFRLDLTVDGADDPANVIEEPVVPDATPLPSGDPAVVALVRGIRAAGEALDRYVLTVETTADATDAVVTSTVVNRPAPAVLVETTGADASAFLVIGEDAWTRDDSGPWVVTERSEVPVCGTDDGTTPDPGAGTAQDPGDCSGLLTSLLEPAVELAVTFTLAGEETVNGTASIHLHSDAGMGSGGMMLPGRTDIWVAKDGGWLVRFVFEGSGTTYDVATSRVNDPSIRLLPPVGAPPVP